MLPPVSADFLSLTIYSSSQMHKMKKLPFLILILLLSLWAKRSFAQVSISPEIGFSRAPFVVYGANTKNESKRLELLLGINGQFNLTEKLRFNARVSYVDREGLKWADLCICPDYLYTEYKQEELNLDFNIMYPVYKNIYLGIGPSLIQKLNAEFIDTDIDMVTVWDFSDLYYGINGLLEVKYRRFAIKLMYIRRFKPDDLVIKYTEGINRFDFTISYAVFGGRKKNQ